MIGIRLTNKNPNLKEMRVGQKQLDSLNRAVFEKIKKNNEIMLEKQAMFLYNEYRRLPPVDTGKLQSSINVYAGLRIARVSWHAVNPKDKFVYSDYVAWRNYPEPGKNGGIQGFMYLIIKEAKWNRAGLILKSLY